MGLENRKNLLDDQQQEGWNDCLGEKEGWNVKREIEREKEEREKEEREKEKREKEGLDGKQEQEQEHHSKYQQQNQLLLHHYRHHHEEYRSNGVAALYQVTPFHHRTTGENVPVDSKMLHWPHETRNKGTGPLESMVTLGLPILASILFLLCILFVLILIIRKRTEPKIPDLSDPKEEEEDSTLLSYGGNSLLSYGGNLSSSLLTYGRKKLDDDPLLYSSNITKELFYPPRNMDKFSSSGNFSSLDSSWLSPSSTEWLKQPLVSILNDTDLYDGKNYHYSDYEEDTSRRGSDHSLPSSSYLRTSDTRMDGMRGKNSSSYELGSGSRRRGNIRDSALEDEQLSFSRRGKERWKEEERWKKGEERNEEKGEGEEKEEERSLGFRYNSPQPERMPLPPSSFLSNSQSNYSSSTSSTIPSFSTIPSSSSIPSSSTIPSFSSSSSFIPSLSYSTNLSDSNLYHHHHDPYRARGGSYLNPRSHFNPFLSSSFGYNHYSEGSGVVGSSMMIPTSGHQDTSVAGGMILSCCDPAPRFMADSSSHHLPLGSTCSCLSLNGHSLGLT